MSDLDLGDGFFAAAGRFLWHEGERVVVVADLHLGVGESRREVGLGFSDLDDEGVRRDWGKVVERVGERGRVVIAGDLFDSRRPGERAIEAAKGLVERLPAGVEVEMVRGNHDPSEERLREIFVGTRVRVVERAEVAGYLVLHGDRVGDRAEGMRGLIVGHQHPAVVLRDRVQAAKMVCFGWGEVDGRRLIVLPAFSRGPLGSNLLTGRNWILDVERPRLSGFRVGGIVGKREGDVVLDFGTLEGLGEDGN